MKLVDSLYRDFWLIRARNTIINGFPQYVSKIRTKRQYIRGFYFTLLFITINNIFFAGLFIGIEKTSIIIVLYTCSILYLLSIPGYLLFWAGRPLTKKTRRRYIMEIYDNIDKKVKAIPLSTEEHERIIKRIGKKRITDENNILSDEDIYQKLISELEEPYNPFETEEQKNDVKKQIMEIINLEGK